MAEIICFITGIAVGVFFEKQLVKFKTAAIRAAHAARDEFDKH